MVFACRDPGFRGDDLAARAGGFFRIAAQALIVVLLAVTELWIVRLRGGKVIEEPDTTVRKESCRDL